MNLCAHVCGYPWRSEEGVRYFGDGVAGICEAPDVDAVPHGRAPIVIAWAISLALNMAS